MTKSIPSEITDANDLYTGIWNKTVVKTLAHMPNVNNVNTTPWFVFCFYGANVNQITWQQNSDGGPIFKRTRYGSGEWTNWVQINQHPYLSSYSDLAALVTGISGASNLSTLATALGVGSAISGTDETLQDRVQKALVDSYTNAESYSVFEGFTSAQGEGAWYGYKSATFSTGIFFSHTYGLCFFKFTNSENLTVKRICRI